MPDQVLHLIDHLGLGGAQRIVSDLVESEGHCIYALRGSKHNISTGDEGVKVAESYSRYNLKCVLGVYMKLDRNEFDVVHCHLTKSKLLGFLMKIVSRKDFELVFHEHGKIIRDDRPYEKFLEISRSYVDRHIAVSREAKRLLEKEGIQSEKIDVIYNFADRETFNSDEIEKFSLETELDTNSLKVDENFVVGFAGRIIEMKGWRTFVSSVEKLEGEVGAIIAGSGPEKELLESKIDELENIAYIGHIEEIRKLLGCIDCLVLPSHWDASPMVLYEAQASGVPIVASNVVSINELIEDKQNGLLFEPKNPDELSSAIMQLKKNPQNRRSLRESGLDFAKEHRLETYLRKLEKTYERAKVN